MYILILCVMLGAVLFQGGFFPSIFLIAAMILSVATAISKKHRPGICEIVLFLCFIVYCLTSLINGYDSSSLAQACLPGALAFFLYAYNCAAPCEKEKIIEFAVIVSGAFSILAILAFCDVIPITGAVTARRLQFTFQYANATGAWFAAVILLGQDRKNRKTSTAIIPCISALLLTRSVGALGTYIIAQTIRLIVLRKNKDLWHGLIADHIIAAFFSVAFFFVNGWPAVPLVILLGVTGSYRDKINMIAERLRLHWVCLFAGIACVPALLLSRRVSASVLTFAERLSQIKDGSHIILDNPMTGVGAGNWKLVYPYYQSAQYTSTVVHSSIIQVGVDAGALAVVLICIFIFFAYRRKGRPLGCNLAAGLLIVHSLLDITAQFFPICALTLVALFDISEDDRKAKQGSKVSSSVVIAISLASSVFFSCMFFTELRSKQLVLLSQVNKWDVIADQYTRQRAIFGKNSEMKDLYCSALYYAGEYERVAKETDASSMADTSALLLRADSIRMRGDQDAACRLLLCELERQKYRVILFEQVSGRLLDWGADSKYLDEYNRIVDLANASQTVLGRLQGDRVNIDHIKRGGAQ